jgi:hypothetical protein
MKLLYAKYLLTAATVSPFASIKGNNTTHS